MHTKFTNVGYLKKTVIQKEIWNTADILQFYFYFVPDYFNTTSIYNNRVGSVPIRQPWKQIIALRFSFCGIESFQNQYKWKPLHYTRAVRLAYDTRNLKNFRKLTQRLFVIAYSWLKRMSSIHIILD